MWCEHDVHPTPHSGTLGWWAGSPALVHAEAFGRWSDIVTRTRPVMELVGLRKETAEVHTCCGAQQALMKACALLLRRLLFIR